MTVQEINGRLYINEYDVEELIAENQDLKKKIAFLLERENKLQQIETIIKQPIEVME